MRVEPDHRELAPTLTRATLVDSFARSLARSFVVSFIRCEDAFCPTRFKPQVLKVYDRLAARFSYTVVRLARRPAVWLFSRVYDGFDVPAEDVEQVRAAMRDGCRFDVAAIDSIRFQVQRTGRSSSQAATASSGWTERSSLPPNPPPQAVGTIRTSAGAIPMICAISSRSI